MNCIDNTKNNILLGRIKVVSPIQPRKGDTTIIVTLTDTISYEPDTKSNLVSNSQTDTIIATTKSGKSKKGKLDLTFRTAQYQQT